MDVVLNIKDLASPAKQSISLGGEAVPDILFDEILKATQDDTKKNEDIDAEAVLGMLCANAQCLLNLPVSDNNLPENDDCTADNTINTGEQSLTLSNTEWQAPESIDIEENAAFVDFDEEPKAEEHKESLAGDIENEAVIKERDINNPPLTKPVIQQSEEMEKAETMAEHPNIEQMDLNPELETDTKNDINAQKEGIKPEETGIGEAIEEYNGKADLKIEVKTRDLPEKAAAPVRGEKQRVENVPVSTPAEAVVITKSNNDVKITVSQSAPQIIEAVESKIIERATYMEAGDIREFEIELTPKFLGKMVIRLAKDESGMKVRIITSNQEVREILSMRAELMQTQIKDRGVEMNNLEVVYTNLSNGFFDSGSMAGRHGHSQSRQAPSYAAGEAYVQNSAYEGEKLMDININGTVSYLV